MQIYTIRKGDTLFNIAKAFNSTVTDIVTANELPEPSRLVIGQTLVIPTKGNFYFVKPGDSLYLIGRKFGINYLEIARISDINPNTPLTIGQKLFIPPYPKVTKEVNAYIEPLGKAASENLLNETVKAAPYLTYLTTFSYQVNNDGTLTPPPLTGITEIAANNGNTLMMAVTNIQNGEFSATLGKEILESEKLQDLLIDNIIAEANKVGLFSDIHFDFEFLPSDMKIPYNNFLRKAADRIRKEGYLVSSALAPKIKADQKGQWYEAHDYKAHGEIMDFVVLMTYEWGYSAGPPLPVSPINEVKKVLNYALTEIPANKIMLGQNLYGYDWTLPYNFGGDFAKAISPQRAITIARDNNAEILYDYTAQSPYFNYTDNNGSTHKVWFEDARSIQAKLNLIKNLGLRGISYWKLGLSFPQNWLLVGDNFDVIKK